MDFFLVVRPAIAALSGVINFPADEMEDVLEPGANLGRGGVDSGCLLRLPDRLGVAFLCLRVLREEGVVAPFPCP